MRIPLFRSIWIANILSNFGGLIQSIGASWTMTSLTSSSTLVALVQASTTLPIMLLSLWAGAIADNLDRRKVMLAAQCFMLVVSAGLAAVAWSGLLSPWLLLAFTFLIGCGTALNSPAYAASAGDIVPRPMLPSAVALNSMGFNLARSAGPALGGVIVATAGAAAAFLVNAVSYLGLIVTLARWKTEPAPGHLPRETIGAAMAAGIRYVAMSPNLRIVLARALLFGLPSSATLALMPIVVRDTLHGDAMTYGLLSGAFGVGAVGGALVSVRLRRRLSPEGLVRLSVAGLAFGSAVLGLSPFIPLTIVGLLFAGASWVMALSTFNVTVQLATPRWVVARALSLYQMVAFGGMAAGAWLFGGLAESHGASISLLVAAAILIAGLLVGLRLPLPEAEAMNLDLLARWTEPETEVPVQSRSGPIVVTIEYRIAAPDIPAFLTAMNERRRIRIRDGARNWTLLRDLGDAALWLERYHVATWVDYVRHNQRRTYADVENFEEIRALHRGPDAPVVHRMIERQTSALTISREPGAREIAPPVTDPSQSA